MYPEMKNSAGTSKCCEDVMYPVPHAGLNRRSNQTTYCTLGYISECLRSLPNDYGIGLVRELRLERLDLGLSLPPLISVEGEVIEMGFKL